MKLFWFIFIVVTLAVVLRWVVVPNLSTTPSTLGTVDGTLRPCPAGSQRCAFASESMTLPADLAMTRVRAALASMPGVTIDTDSGSYLHAIARTRVMGFIDDVEIAIDADSSVLQLRSASRLGKLDFGKNADRLREIGRKTGPV